MANPLTPWIKKFIPAKILNILTLITNALVKGRDLTGAYDIQDGPQIAPQGFLGGLKGDFVKKQTLDVLEKAAAGDDKVEKGMSHWQAALFTAASTILIGAVQGLDFSTLFSHPRDFVGSLLTAVVVQWGVYLSEPNRSKIDIGSNGKVARAAELHDVITVNAEIPGK